MHITPESIELYAKRYAERPALHAAALAIGKHPVDEVAFDQSAAAKIPHLYNHEIKTMKVTNQRSSGRCWLFAGLNLLRERVANTCQIEQFELSQNYAAFYDKLEKSNYLLESILATLDEPTYSRIVDYIVTTGVQDGGQWDMFASLITKYGVVPQSAMPETFLSSNSRSINNVLNIKLRRTAAMLRHMHAEGKPAEELEALRESVMDEIYSILCAAYGCPPTTFDWEYKTKDGEFVRVAGLTPKSFFDKFVAFPFHEYVSVIHAPTKDKPFNRKYTVRFLGNVVGGAPVVYLNAEMNIMKRAILAQLDAGEIVWFGSDVGWFMDRQDGRFALDLIDYSPLFGGFAFDTSKEDKLDYRMSAMNHAMAITGYHEVDGKPVRYKIQNSWGDERGDKGYFAMSDAWFDQFVYQAVVRKELLSKELLAALDEEPIELNPWDPMGALAD